MVLETFDEFGWRERGGTEFANYNPGGVIGDFGGFLQSGAGAEGEGIKRDGGVARAGDVEDLLRAGGV